MTTASPTQYNLNDGQKNAAEAFLAFLFGTGKEFIISGPAGVGKTYLMNYIIDTTMPLYHEACQLIGEKPLYTQVVMTATTNKAADVLAQATRRPTSTVHSFFGLKVDIDYSNGQTLLKKSNRWEVKDRQIIFVDESSLIDTELWKLLHEGTSNCKLVYVGDHYQLAPVHEDLSPVYKHDAPMVELTEQVRNAGQPALMALCEQMRETVRTGVFKPIRMVPGVIDHLDGNQMQAQVDAHFANQTATDRILAYTNRRVIEFNDHIRTIRNLPESYQAGELLVCSNAYQRGKLSIPVEAEVTVLLNRGRKQVLLDEREEILLDVDYLDLETDLGDIHREVPFPVNRRHFDELVKYYAKRKDWPNYFLLKNQYADLRPRDAATVHKAQGSSYDTVFIDLGNISTCNIPSQVARMLYVAFSRARTRVFVYGDLAEKYGGLIL